MNVKEYRRGNQKWTIQRNWQHKVHKTKKNKTKTQHNILDTTMYKQAQITQIRHESSYKQQVDHAPIISTNYARVNPRHSKSGVI